MRLPCAAAVTALALTPLAALAQPAPATDAPTAPWASASPAEPPPDPATLAPPVRATRWPTITAPRLVSPAFTVPTPVARELSEPAVDHHFQMPTARPMRMGDLQGHYVSALGWVALRYGLTRNIDVGVGVPYYFAGASVDARFAFVNRPGLAVSWWAYLTIPFKPEGESSTSNLGFTWAYAGLGWMTGPLVSVWSGRVGVHGGLHAAQRTGLGGLWGLAHVTVDVRVHEGIKVIAQTVLLHELAEEQGDRARALLGNGALRFMPYALAGVRFYTRRFAADVGVLAPLSERAPLYAESLAVLPWMSLSHTF